jgi:hypothetical protein
LAFRWLLSGSGDAMAEEYVVESLKKLRGAFM